MGGDGHTLVELGVLAVIGHAMALRNVGRSNQKLNSYSRIEK